MGVLYTQGGISRAIDNDFPCPLIGEARKRWGAGIDTWVECSACKPVRQIKTTEARKIVVTYEDGTRIAVNEIWPVEVPR